MVKYNYSDLRLVNNSDKKYSEFIRILRNDKRVLTGFVEKIYITKEMQKSYMKIYCNNYHICLLKNDPVGFVGVIDNDIRICVHPDHQQKGIGKLILREILKLYPQAKGRIKKGNISSQRLFKKCEVPFEII